jgi:hypothetical protein
MRRINGVISTTIPNNSSTFSSSKKPSAASFSYSTRFSGRIRSFASKAACDDSISMSVLLHACARSTHAGGSRARSR